MNFRLRHSPLCPGLLLPLLLALCPLSSSGAAQLGQELGAGLAATPRSALLPAVEGQDPAWLSHLIVPRARQGAEDVLLGGLLPDLQAAGHQLILTLEPGAVSGDHSLWASRWADEIIDTVAGLDATVVAILPALPPGERDASQDAFLLKQTAVAVRAARPGMRVVLELQGPQVDMVWLTALHDEEIATYIDAWAWRLAAGQEPPTPESIRALNRRRLELDPASPLWVLGLPARGQGSMSPTSLAGSLLTAGAAALTFHVDRPAEREVLHTLRTALPVDADPMPGGVPLFRTMEGTPVDSIQAWSFFAAARAQAMVLLVPAGALPARVQMEIPTFDVSSPFLLDPQTGAVMDLGGGIPDRRRNRTLVTLAGVDGPRLVSYLRFATPGVEREDVAVDTLRDPTVEEILVRHQEVAALASDGVHTVSADALVKLHYTVAGSGATIDVAYDSRYYWDEEVGAEFEYVTMYLNGARWRRGKFPNLPLIQAEKVVTPPLQIVMGRQYAYRLKGREMVGGRPAWRISFEPRDAGATRYRGTAWIDRETFRLLKQDVIQTGLEAPVVSSEETSLYAAFPIPAGGVVSLPASTRGQQGWSVGGARFVIFREVFFSNVRINEEAFQQRREEAYASGNQMLRDTDQGQRYLLPDDAGGRTLQDRMRTRSLFLLGGGFYNEAVDSAIPFVGFDYFDYNIKDSGQQVNFFLAGAANFLTWANPDVGGTPLELSARLSLIGFASADRFFVDGSERPEADVKGRSQSLSAALGVPVGQFMKFLGRFGLLYENYQNGEDMAPTFIVPSDTLIPNLSLEWQFNRKGFTVLGDVTGFRRQDWEVWGDPDPGSDLVASRVVDYSPDDASFTRWSALVSQDLFFKAFQKVRISATWLDGHNLDRFSSYQFSFFGERQRLSGFSGSGVRFDRGLLGRARYTFNMANVVTFEVGVDHARVEYLPGDEGPQSHTGVGIAGKFVGPWGLLIRLEYGYALRSDIPAVEGEQEGQLLFLKIF